MANTMSKSELIQRIVEGHANEIARKDVKGVIEAVAEIGHKELKKTGAFVMPGLAKFIVIKKPATKARQGINPFTKEPTVFKAKPARKIVRARPVKAAKDAGIEKVHFAYSGEAEPGKPYTYQIQGPTFVAQFLNVQPDGSGNPNNHIHSVWRRLPSDFGLATK